MFRWFKKKQNKFAFDFSVVEQVEIQKDYEQICREAENRKVSSKTITIFGVTRPITVGDLLHLEWDDSHDKCWINNLLREVKSGRIKLD